MIASFAPKAKALRKYWLGESRGRGLPQESLAKIRSQLTALNSMSSLDDILCLPGAGWGLHKLHGNLEGYWAIKVSGNWRIIFTFNPETKEVHGIDSLDYH